MIEADLHDLYGIDVDDPTVLFGRSWFWLRDRILAILAVPPAFAIEANQKRHLVPSTRLQWVLQAKQSQEG